ncbi:mannonate dehydratase [Ginsengibacter hankyongi]|uniref:Mannonate dehydratase n=1 Tax=Ginsengibacter hankyongi TaxID=2607284 RepID=A0A5J5ICV8_9BACT|nr:mannonate dehydratase [Ginsengibacter hankyongi]KAA9037587.1 mannonate dehydratase [Ginsengibacter hankyongi]
MKYKMKQTWRWFGPSDPVSLQDVKQTGAEGVVTALHHIPHGEIWTVDEINKRKAEIEKVGLTWSVVESITVHENIKTRTGAYKEYIEKYKTSIRNVAACGIPIITYNFMPVNDWTRTSLNYKMSDGSLALYFNWIDLAVFDIYILKRKNADSSYSTDILQKAEERFKNYSEKDLEALGGVVMFGIPGEKKISTNDMLQKLELYKDIDANTLRENLCYFQKEISEVAEDCGVKLAIHPDDPPFPILGLPRIVSTQNDYEYFLNKVDNSANGVCFCTGSLGASKNNDLTGMVKSFGEKIHFIHLRNVKKDEEGNFYEADHLSGDNDMYSIVKELLRLQQKMKISIPFRPDHGHQMLDDLNKTTNPGYSAIGRLRGLAEIRGLEMGIIESLQSY